MKKKKKIENESGSENEYKRTSQVRDMTNGK